MKKLILAMVFVFATGTMMNANNNNSEIIVFDCLDEAWDFGTEHGGGDEFEEWYWTNEYYEVNCLDEWE